VVTHGKATYWHFMAWWHSTAIWFRLYQTRKLVRLKATRRWPMDDGFEHRPDARHRLWLPE